DLVGCSADATWFDLEHGRRVPQRQLEGLDRIAPGLVLHDCHGVVHDALGRRVLAGVHQLIDEPGDRDVMELGIRRDHPLANARSTWHSSSVLLAPLTSSSSPAWEPLPRTLSARGVDS